jgi:uncharacterized membrane protein
MSDEPDDAGMSLGSGRNEIQQASNFGGSNGFSEASGMARRSGPPACQAKEPSPEDHGEERGMSLGEQLAAVMSTLNAKKNENTQRSKRFDELLNLRLEAATTSLDWIRTFHISVSSASEPEIQVKEEISEIEGEQKEKTLFGEIVALIVVIMLGLLVVGLILLIIWPIVVLILVVVAIIVLLFYVHVAYRYNKWCRLNASRTRDCKEDMQARARKLDAEIEHLRGSYKATEKEIDELQARHKALTTSLKEAEEKSKLETASPSTDSNQPTAAMPSVSEAAAPGLAHAGAAGAGGGEVVKPASGGGIFGMVKKAVKAIPVLKCPNCGENWASRPTRRESIRHKDSYKWDFRPVAVHYDNRGNPTGYTEQEVRILVRKTFYNQHYKCRKCSHEWFEHLNDTKEYIGE